MQIYDLIPDASILISLAPEELAYSLLSVAANSLQNGKIHRDYILSFEPQFGQDPIYPRNLSGEIFLALSEALNWLEVQGLLLPDSGSNGANGFRILSRRARDLDTEEKFNYFRNSVQFPKSFIHPAIADRTWITLARGELSDAVFIAFRTVEEAVRAAGGFAATDYGADMMRRAFNPNNGPLTDLSQPMAERESLQGLFAGSIGSYKNPHSHRTVTIDDPREAQEMVILASHLLRIVDARV